MLHSLHLVKQVASPRDQLLMKDWPKFIKTTGKRQMDVSLKISTLDTYIQYDTKALLGSGCTGPCINQRWIIEQGIQTQLPAHPIPVYNMDGTWNRGGLLTEWVQLQVQIGGHC